VLVGVFGAGQLGRMLALAGIPLGLRFRFLDPHASPCAAELGEHIRGAFDDTHAIARFADGLDIATIEFENIPPHALEIASRTVPVLPSAKSLGIAKDRVKEKQLFERCGIPYTPTATISGIADLGTAVERIGAPGILKSRSEGYDGKGQARIESADDASAAFESIGCVPAVYERFVEFDHECSLVAVRSGSGEIVFYPLAINTHTRGILTKSHVPQLSHPLTELARSHARSILDDLQHVGVLTIEFFVRGDTLTANEIAPRVHNTGHWTIDAARTSQFENHVRAIAGFPLGPTDLTVPHGCTMLNLIGGIPEVARMLAFADARVHLYGKEPRPGRKVGHVTWCGDQSEEFSRLERLVEKSNLLAGA